MTKKISELTPNELAAYKAYQQSDAYKASRKASKLHIELKEHYLKQKEQVEKTLKQYSLPPIPLQGKLLSINNILSNIEGIERYVASLNADDKTKRITMNVMLENLLEREGLLVSRREAIEPRRIP